MRKRINSCIRILTAALTAVFIFPQFCGMAFATGIDVSGPESEPAAIESTSLWDSFVTEGDSSERDGLPGDAGASDVRDAPITDYPEKPPKPFTPGGTGTVVNEATDEDGKEFYTITTPDENVFYLVIDRQRGAENVYFLNAVTEADLLALAEKAEKGGAAGPLKTTPPKTEEPPTPAEPSPTPPTAEQERSGGNMARIVIIALIVILGGGAGWYFKIYKPKQQKSGFEEDYSASDTDAYAAGERDAESGGDGLTDADELSGYDDQPGEDGSDWYDGNEAPEADGADNTHNSDKTPDDAGTDGGSE
jgi:hypothetical protein